VSPTQNGWPNRAPLKRSLSFLFTYKNILFHRFFMWLFIGLCEAIDSCQDPEVWVFTPNIHPACTIKDFFLSHDAMGQMECFETGTL
jgi:hypothetical protein